MSRAGILVIDNYDSFTFNLVQYLRELGARVQVRRNDDVTVDDIVRMRPHGLLISPGPGRPADSGITSEAVRGLAGRVPILGVCLGHQAVGEVFGGAVVRAERVMHGKSSLVHHDGTGVFRGLSSPMLVTRYHSLVVDRERLPDTLRITAWTEEGELMGLSHRSYRVEGVQFHPESITSTQGRALLANWLEALADSR